MPSKSQSLPLRDCSTVYDDEETAAADEDSCPDMESALQQCEEQIGYQFSNRVLLKRCLTHSSNATTRLDCNERLEFLGDAILGMIICEHLFRRYPDRREGQLTQHKSHLVSGATCARVGHRLGIGRYLIVGRGLRRIPDSLIAAAVESLIAGIYLDSSLEVAGEFIMRAFGPELEDSTSADAENYKSILQEVTQRDSNEPPTYVILEERGPDHAREFCVAARVGQQTFESAWGRSKKEAEQKAAFHALEAKLSEQQQHEVKSQGGDTR